VAIVVPDQSLLDSLALDIAAGRLLGATLHAYAFAHAPAAGDLAADYTAIESAFGGYSPITIDDWAAPVLEGHVAVTRGGIRSWTYDGTIPPESVWGIFVLDSGGDLAYAEASPMGGVLLNMAGQSFPYRPVFSRRST
jgi:hypothetical protein